MFSNEDIKKNILMNEFVWELNLLGFFYFINQIRMINTKLQVVLDFVPYH